MKVVEAVAEDDNVCQVAVETAHHIGNATAFFHGLNEEKAFGVRDDGQALCVDGKGGGVGVVVDKNFIKDLGPVNGGRANLVVFKIMVAEAVKMRVGGPAVQAVGADGRPGDAEGLKVVEEGFTPGCRKAVQPLQDAVDG